jgi:hypothetical protein
MRKSPIYTTVWPAIAALIILSLGLYRALVLRWICDDAFITLRYVSNILDGHGLVYNIGERVEGYTHFLWLLLLSGAGGFGFDAVQVSIWLGILSYVLTLLLLLMASYREFKKNASKLWLPVCGVLFALNYDTAEWASGGLETAFFTFLIIAAFFLWFYSNLHGRARVLSVGTVLAFISLTRPDGVLFTLIAVLLLLATTFRNRAFVAIARSSFFLLLPSIIVGVPYLVWKYSYYGDILPLTFYAKSAEHSYFSQGMYYVWLYVQVHYVSSIAEILAIIALIVRVQKHGVRGEAPFVAATIAGLTYLIFFVVRTGGDFMFARFIIPVLPLLLFVIEGSIRRVTPSMSWLRTALPIAMVTGVIIEEKIPTTPYFTIENGKRVEDWNLVGVTGETKWIADERYFYYDRYPVEHFYYNLMETYSTVGKSLKQYFEGLPVTVSIPGAMNMIAYYANFKTAINEYGLTDVYIAHSSLAERGHIGHEKRATRKYLERRRVHFALEKIMTAPAERLGFTAIEFHIPEINVWLIGRVITYDKEIMHELAERFKAAHNTSKIPLLEQSIQNYAEHSMQNRPLDLLEKDYTLFRHLYFEQYPDSSLEHHFESRIAMLKNDSRFKEYRKN